MDIDKQKQELRKKYLLVREEFFNSFSKDHETNLMDNLFSLEEFDNAEVVLSYMSKGKETPTINLNLKILNSKKSLCLPKTDLQNKKLIIKKISSFKDLEQGPFGIMEPKEECENMENIDLGIIPGILFDKTGNRLGYGLGFYDRFLQNKNFFKIGFCFSCQIIDNFVCNKYDVKMDCLVNEKSILRIKK